MPNPVSAFAMVEVGSAAAHSCSGLIENRHRSEYMTYTDLVAIGPELCREAIRAGRGVNESHLLVHRLLSDLLREDIAHLPETALREQLSLRLRAQLGALAG